MANTKISALPLASTPLAGTEVLPIVQGGITEQVATNDLTVRNVRANATTGILQVTGPAAASTRVMTVPDANFTAARTDAAQSFTGNQTLSTGNLIIGTSGQGIDFSATPGTGTSELLADYEEGTWTPIVVGTTTAGTGTYIYNAGVYTKVGRLVYYEMELFYTAHTGTGNMQINGLPFTVGASGTAIANPSGLLFSNNLVIVALSSGTALVPFTYASDASRAFLPLDTSAIITVSGTYSV